MITANKIQLIYYHGLCEQFNHLHVRINRPNLPETQIVNINPHALHGNGKKKKKPESPIIDSIK